MTDPHRYNGCFGCGPDNPDGMHLSFQIEDDRVVGRFSLPVRFQGPPGHLHGGVIATILDEAMSKVNAKYGQRAMTAHLDVRYRRPVPIDRQLVVEARRVRGEKRNLFNRATIHDENGTLLAEAQGRFVLVSVGSRQ